MQTSAARMTSAERSGRAQRRRRSLPVALTAVVVALLSVLGIPAAVAHTGLTGTDPADGEILARAPATVTLSFNEPVGATAESVQVYTPSGAPMPVDVQALDATVTIAPEAPLGPGTHTVAWRATSADGHPISGAFTFSVGAPSATAVELPAQEPLPRAMIGAQTVAYLGVFAAAGLVVFELAFLSAGRGAVPGTRRRLHRLVRLAAVAAAVGAVCSVLAAPGGQGAPGSVTAPAPVAALTTAGVLVAVLAIPHAATGHRGFPARAAALFGAGVAGGSLVLTGHTRSAEPGWLVVTADVVHIAAGVTWVGGLLGMVVVLGRASDTPAHHATTALARFSTAAAWVVAALATTGLILGWRILGSLQALMSTGYGQFLLIKVALVGLVVLVAVWNRYVLLPRVLTEGDVDALSTLRSAVQGEAVVLGLILLLTGVLTNLSP